MAEGGVLANKKKNAFSLNHLTDELLIEILRRLPTAKSVLSSCILVCKRWHSLIFRPFYFVSRFVEHHRNQNKNSCYTACRNSPCVFIRPIVYPGMQFHSNPSSNGNKPFFVIGGEEASFASPGYTLEFLPEKTESISVLASCNDLLLCEAAKDDADYSAYYVCNPLTRRWFLVPPSTVPIRRYSFRNICFGLVYDSKYYCRFDQERYECRFRVVCVDDNWMLVYCSEIEQWSETPLLGDDQEYNPCSGCSNAVTLDGKLYWLNFRGNIVAFDPFTDETDFFDASDEYYSQISKSKGPSIVSSCLGICNGALWFMKSYGYLKIVDNEVAYLGIWELKDYESRRMTLKQRIFLNTRSSLVKEYGSWNIMRAHLLSFHPTEEDMVYVELSGRIISCKIQEEDLEVVGKVFYNRKRYWSLSSNDAITTALPWWPTPV